MQGLSKTPTLKIDRAIKATAALVLCFLSIALRAGKLICPRVDCVLMPLAGAHRRYGENLLDQSLWSAHHEKYSSAQQWIAS